MRRFALEQAPSNSASSNPNPDSLAIPEPRSPPGAMFAAGAQVNRRFGSIEVAVLVSVEEPEADCVDEAELETELVWVLV